MLKQVFVILISIVFFTTICSCSDRAELQPLEKNTTILAFGDSLTYGSGTSHDKAYPAILEAVINHKVINAGIPGEVSSQGLARLPRLIEQLQPGLIIICHGGNDILRKLDLNKTRDNIQKMIDLAIQNNSQVVLIAVPEFGLFLQPSPIYQTLAQANQLPIAEDILADILRQSALKADHIHPNSEGYQILAQHIAQLLKQSGALVDD